MAHLLGIQRGGQAGALQGIFLGVHRRGHVERENKGKAAGGLRLRRGGPQKAGGQKGGRPYQWPVFSMLAQGSAGSSASPSCSSSTDTLSGLRTKAMRPSRGGRLMVTPLSCRCWHIS